MKRIALTCKDSGKFFHDCKDCQHYDDCDYFGKNKEATMSRNNLTKQQIREASALELVLRRDFLFALEESTPNGTGISMADARECVDIDAELRRKLKKLLPCSSALRELLK